MTVVVDPLKTQYSSTFITDKIPLFSTLTDGQGYSTAATIGITAATPPASTVFIGSVANPYGRKCLGTLSWSIDGTNFYPQNVPIYYFNATFSEYLWQALTFIGCSSTTTYVGVTSQYGSAQTIYLQLALDSPT